VRARLRPMALSSTADESDDGVETGLPVLLRARTIFLILRSRRTTVSAGANHGAHNVKGNKISRYGRWCKLAFIHGHRTLKAPHPVRSAQLTKVPPS
jgi:hypothetical protein